MNEWIYFQEDSNSFYEKSVDDDGNNCYMLSII